MRKCRKCGRELLIDGLGIGPECLKLVNRENLFYDKYNSTEAAALNDENVGVASITSFPILTTAKIKANELLSVNIDPTLLGPNLTSLFYRDPSRELGLSITLEYYFKYLINLGVIPKDSVLSSGLQSAFFNSFDGAIFFYPHANPNKDTDDVVFLTLYTIPEDGKKEKLIFTTREFGVLHKESGNKTLMVQNANYDGFDFKGKTLFAKDANDFEKIENICAKLIEKKNNANKDYDYSILSDSTKTMQFALDEITSRVFVRSFLRQYAPGLSEKNDTNIILEFTPGKLKEAFAQYLVKKKPGMDSTDKEIVKKSFQSQLIRELFNENEIEIMEDFIDQDDSLFSGAE